MAPDVQSDVDGGTGREISPDDWALLKSVWFEVEHADEPARTQRLAEAALPPRVRTELQRMIAASSNVLDRFEAPAHAAMSFSGNTGGSRRDDAAPSLVGRRLGAFRLLRLVARGGMGAVYEAERDDAQYTQRVAIKSIWRGADSDVLLQRFRAERQILAGLQHPNIARLIDGGATEEGTPWLAMEFVEGLAIDAYCDANQLSITARLDLFRQICQAVHYAHQHLIVHRDLKPSNVMVTVDGTVKLLDFGVAKLLDDSAAASTLTNAGGSPFTADYAAPEQVNGGAVSTATDVYALGAILTTLLAGAPPIALDGLDPIARILAVRDGVTHAPSDIAHQQSEVVAQRRGCASARKLSIVLRGELDAIAGMALRREPQRRYASVAALDEDVWRYLRRDRVMARPDTFSYRVWSFARRQRALAIGFTLAVVFIATSAAIAMRQAAAIREEAARAERVGVFLSGMVAGPSATSGDRIISIGPGGTVAQLLDSALTRVPREFAGDNRTRARLYTAIGANFAAQTRYRTARTVLDSARRLAAQSYGRNSQEFVDASLEYAALQLKYVGPDASEQPLREALVALSERSDPDARARVLIMEASQDMARGEVRRADSLARVVRDMEARHGRSTSTSAKAEKMLVYTSSWLRRDPREYLRRARGLIALTDSLGMPLSDERSFAVSAEIEALIVLGRIAEAEQRVRADTARTESVYGRQTLVAAHAASTDALMAGLRGDTALRREKLATARTALRQTADVPPVDRLLISNAFVDDALARGALDEAATVALETRDIMQATRSPLFQSFAELYVGATKLAKKDAVGAESALRAGITAVANAPDLYSMLPRLRRPLVLALEAQGRTAEADSVRKLDPPKATMPPCTPGGKWVGCPDR